jgi:hypothetical protein
MRKIIVSFLLLISFMVLTMSGCYWNDEVASNEIGLQMDNGVLYPKLCNQVDILMLVGIAT